LRNFADTASMMYFL